MNSLSKKVMTGTIAASLLFGGFAALQTTVLAAEDTTAVTSTSSTTSTIADEVRSMHAGRGHMMGHGGMRGNNLVEGTATALGIEASVVKTELDSGKTFAEIAVANGLTKAEYLSKLTVIEIKAIDDLLSEGTITAAQAEEKKSTLADRLATIIESNRAGHEGPGGQGGMGGPGKMHGFGHFGNLTETAAILSMTEDEVKTALDAGKSLTELAEAKGLTEAQLIEKLKASMTDELQEFVNMKKAVQE